MLDEADASSGSRRLLRRFNSIRFVCAVESIREFDQSFAQDEPALGCKFRVEDVRQRFAVPGITFEQASKNENQRTKIFADRSGDLAPATFISVRQPPLCQRACLQMPAVLLRAFLAHRRNIDQIVDPGVACLRTGARQLTTPKAMIQLPFAAHC